MSSESIIFFYFSEYILSVCLLVALTNLKQNSNYQYSTRHFMHLSSQTGTRTKNSNKNTHVDRGRMLLSNFRIFIAFYVKHSNLINMKLFSFAILRTRGGARARVCV